MAIAQAVVSERWRTLSGAIQRICRWCRGVPDTALRINGVPASVARRVGCSSIYFHESTRSVDFRSKSLSGENFPASLSGTFAFPKSPFMHRFRSPHAAGEVCCYKQFEAPDRSHRTRGRPAGSQQRRPGKT
jgi:hypothetical protein